jgi:hypothetical protein
LITHMLTELFTAIGLHQTSIVIFPRLYSV